MKKFLVFSLSLVAFCSVASAAPACSTSLLTVAPSTPCDVGDVTFSGFGALPANVALQFQTSGINSVSLNLFDTSPTGAGLGNGLSFSYTVQIDPAFLLTSLTRVSAGLGEPNGNGNAVLTKTLTGGLTGVASATDVNGTITPISVTGSTTAAVGVTDALSVTAPTDINFAANAFTWTTTSGVPEPVSLLLFGSGLLAVSLLGRKKSFRR